MSIKKKMSLLAVSVVVMSTILSGCGGNGKTEATTKADTSAAPTNTVAQTETATTPEPLEPVELKYYFPGAPQKDVALVEEAMNKILKEKINATIKLNAVDWGSFEQKLNVMSAGGDEFDLEFTAPWINNYYQNVAKGTLLPLDDLIDKYAPNYKKIIPTQIWDAAKVNGKIYGAINWQFIATYYGAIYRTELLQKYNFDLTKVTKYEDLNPFLEQVVKGDSKFIPVVPKSLFLSQPPVWGMDTIGDDSMPGWIYLNDQDLKVFDQYESPEYKQVVELAHEWYQKGYFQKDVATAPDVMGAVKAGKYAGGVAWPLAPGTDKQEKVGDNWDVTVQPLSKPIIATGRAIATMTGISQTSKHPERAMMFLELINTDKELYNLLCHGIEGTHYKKTADQVIEIVKDSAYNPGTDWMFGDQFNGYYTSADQVGLWEQQNQANQDAAVSPSLGFAFDPEPVKTEITQVGTVLKQYQGALEVGVADPAKVLPEFISKLKGAGVDKIVAEKQKQIDAWKATRK